MEVLTALQDRTGVVGLEQSESIKKGINPDSLPLDTKSIDVYAY